MIEDKGLGLKVAENKEEAFWQTAKERCEQAIFNAEREIEINIHILGLCKARLKNGC